MFPVLLCRYIRIVMADIYGAVAIMYKNMLLPAMEKKEQFLELLFSGTVLDRDQWRINYSETSLSVDQW